MKKCELCKSLATIYCESDQASLCWSCDAKVHSANFLVARHSRNLLCRVCQSPTPWSASGEKLLPTAVSDCEKCIIDGVSDDEGDREDSHGDNDDEIGTDDDDEGEYELDLEDEDDNQVVPWSSPPPAASSSTSEEFPTDRGGYMKRKRENVADPSSEDDDDCSSVQSNNHTPSTAAVEAAIGGNEAPFSFPPSRSEAIVQKPKRIHHRNTISGVNKSVRGMSKSTSAVD